MYPNDLQTTLASLTSNSCLQTVPQFPSWKTSSKPSNGPSPPDNLIFVAAISFKKYQKHTRTGNLKSKMYSIFGYT